MPEHDTRKMPDMTPAQIVALLIGAVPQLLVLFSGKRNPERQATLTNLTAMAIGLIVGDAALRGARNLGARAPRSQALTAIGERQSTDPPEDSPETVEPPLPPSLHDDSFDGPTEDEAAELDASHKPDPPDEPDLPVSTPAIEE